MDNLLGNTCKACSIGWWQVGLWFSVGNRHFQHYTQFLWIRFLFITWLLKASLLIFVQKTAIRLLQPFLPKYVESQRCLGISSSSWPSADNCWCRTMETYFPCLGWGYLWVIVYAPELTYEISLSTLYGILPEITPLTASLCFLVLLP